MRTIISDYLSKTISRRGFIKNMAASGFSIASANSVLGSLGSLREENFLGEAEYRSITGTGGDLLVQQIKEAGVKYVFTNTGSYEVGFFDALVKEPGIQFFFGTTLPLTFLASRA